jgi:hypothetical protein
MSLSFWQCTTKDGEIALLKETAKTMEKASLEAIEKSNKAKDNQLQQMTDAVVVYLFVSLSLSLSLCLCHCFFVFGHCF